MHLKRLARRFLTVATVAGLLLGLTLATLAVVDFVSVGDLYASPVARAQWTLERGDHLHFAWHLLAGRLLDVCPCTRQTALNQYERATYHAGTMREQAAVVNIHPESPREWLGYAAAPFAVGVDWVRDGILWLSGQRPPGHVEVIARGRGCLPAVVHLARSGVVVWRNGDDMPVYIVFPDSRYPIQQLAPGQTLTAFFPVLGRTEYACSIDPVDLKHIDEAGVVIVS